MALNASGGLPCPVCALPLTRHAPADMYQCALGNGGCGLTISGHVMRTVAPHKIRAALKGQGSAVPLANLQPFAIAPSVMIGPPREVAPELKPKEIVAEPIEGWRLWRVKQPGPLALGRNEIEACADAVDRGDNPFRVLLQPKLQAVGIGEITWDKTMHARCETPPPSHPDEAPVAHCTCGMWAYKTLDELLPRLIGSQYQTDMAYGTVQMWGRLIEHQHGYRAQHARPLKVTLLKRDDDDTARSLAMFYGCEVGCGDLPTEAAVKMAEMHAPSSSAVSQRQALQAGHRKTLQMFQLQQQYAQQLQQQNLGLQAQRFGGPAAFTVFPIEPAYRPFPWLLFFAAALNFAVGSVNLSVFHNASWTWLVTFAVGLLCLLTAFLRNP